MYMVPEPLRFGSADKAGLGRECISRRRIMRRNRMLFVFLGALDFAWAQGPSRATFEVASIKPHPEPITFSSDPSVHGMRVTATASTLHDLITTAYHVRYDQISSGPSWAESDHFDISAKAEGEGALTMEQARPMLQALLADRFQLKIHLETREVAMYALVIRKTGAKLQQSAPADESKSGITANSSGMHLTVSKGTMAQLALWLSGNGAGRPVMDKTGLIGSYTYELTWVNGPPGPDDQTPSLFTALQEQLGLRLEATKGPSQIVVIDHAEKPSAN
jgi:uncharacterized protein (TIGR03435 family)